MGGKGWSRVGAWGILSLVSRWRPKARPTSPQRELGAPLGRPQTCSPHATIGDRPEAPGAPCAPSLLQQSFYLEAPKRRPRAQGRVKGARPAVVLNIQAVVPTTRSLAPRT